MLLRIMLTVAFVLSAISAGAVPPDRMAFQGLLRDDLSTPLVGPVSLELRIYDALVGGALLYAESHASVPLVDGVFDIAVGTGTPLPPSTTFDASLFGAADRYVEVVAEGETMSPRQALHSVPFAFHAASADSASSVVNAGACYTRWGGWGCATGFTEVLQGRTGGLENYQNGGSAGTHLACVDAAAPPLQSFAGVYNNRLMRGDAEGDGMDRVDNRCSTCCSGGCYTALGTSTCAAGYTRVYQGRAGGLEAYSAGHSSQTLCVDVAAAPVFTWNTGYSTRLMRHRSSTNSSSNGMDVITNDCTVCCR